MVQLGLGEQPRPDQEAHSLRRLDREAAAPAGNDVDRQVGVLPALVLRHRHPERDGLVKPGHRQLAQEDVGITGNGHMMMIEKNNLDIAEFISSQISATVETESNWQRMKSGRPG